jgi:hypothetical protein
MKKEQIDTDQLIQNMLDEGPQKPLPHPMWQTSLWLLATLFYLATLSGYFGLRGDIAEKFSEPSYFIDILLLFGLGIFSTFAALCLSRPDGYQMPRLKFVPIGFILAWAILAFGGSAEINVANIFHSMSLGQFDCLWHILLFSTPPGLALFLIVRKGATIQYCWAGTMATLSATAFGYLLMRLIEQNDNPVHLIMWHAVPIILMCIVGMIIGKFALKWR